MYLLAFGFTNYKRGLIYLVVTQYNYVDTVWQWLVVAVAGAGGHAGAVVEAEDAADVLTRGVRARLQRRRDEQVLRRYLHTRTL